jgi:hypothetical protein
MATAENSTAAPLEPEQKAQAKAEATPEVLRIYQHTNFFYWWVVWAYGFICGILTYIDGRTVALVNGKELHVHSSAWVGISFVALLLIVAFFTNYRVKGPYSVILILGLVVAAFAMYFADVWSFIFRVFPALLIFMNLAFYLSLSTALFLLWALATFGLARLSYWEFTPGQVTRYQRIGEGSQSWDARGLHLDRVADDILINKILGLRFLGFGTADLKFTTSGAVRETHTIENVWCANQRDKEIRDLIIRLNVPT